jgi:hypothetical protein
MRLSQIAKLLDISFNKNRGEREKKNERKKEKKTQRHNKTPMMTPLTPLERL